MKEPKWKLQPSPGELSAPSETTPNCYSHLQPEKQWDALSQIQCSFQLLVLFYVLNIYLHLYLNNNFNSKSFRSNNSNRVKTFSLRTMRPSMMVLLASVCGAKISRSWQNATFFPLFLYDETVAKPNQASWFSYSLCAVTGMWHNFHFSIV